MGEACSPPLPFAPLPHEERGGGEVLSKWLDFLQNLCADLSILVLQVLSVIQASKISPLITTRVFQKAIIARSK